METNENDIPVITSRYVLTEEIKKRKTNAIHSIKQKSVGLYSKRNYKEITDTDIVFLDSEEEIMRECNVPNNHRPRIDKLYDAIANSGNTITMYEILEWFNEQYKNIKKDAEKLPKLEFMIEKWESGSLEKASFVFDRLVGRYKNNMGLHFIDDNESSSDFFHRKLSFRDGEEAAFINYANALLPTERINVISKEVIKEYLELSKRYLDYLNAYSFLRQPVPTSIGNLYFYKGLFDSSIYGNDPYRKLDRVRIGTYRGGNVDSHFFAYKLGGEKLESPVMTFYDCHVPKSEETIGDIVDNNPHAMAKTLRLNRNYLPFKVE